MNTPLRDELDRVASVLVDAAPDTWVRVYLLAGRLLEDDGTFAGFKDVAVAATYDGELGQAYVTPPLGSDLDALTLDRLAEGEPEEGWNYLRMVLDRDGERRFDFSHEEARRLEDSASDEFWQEAHQYVERNRSELDALVERLRTQGALPGAEAPSTSGRGGLGRLFGKR